MESVHSNSPSHAAAEGDQIGAPQVIVAATNKRKVSWVWDYADKATRVDEDGKAYQVGICRTCHKEVKAYGKSYGTTGNSLYLPSTPHVCHENTLTLMDSVTENAEIFEDESNHGNLMCESLSSKQKCALFIPCSSNDFKSLDSETKMAELMESMKEVLKQFPQDPCCSSFPKDLQEGVTFGLKMAFVALVKSMDNLLINAPGEDFNDMLVELDHFEKYRFSVEQIRDRLKKLKEMHDSFMELHDGNALMMCRVEELKKAIDMRRSRISDISEENDPLSERIGLLNEECKRRMVGMEMLANDLNKAAVDIEIQSHIFKTQFEKLVKSNW